MKVRRFISIYTFKEKGDLLIFIVWGNPLVKKDRLNMQEQGRELQLIS